MQSGDNEQNRKEFLDLLIDAGVGGLDDNPQVTSFLRGTGDITLNELTLDSLTVMEVAIAIEENLGVSLAPGDIIRHSTLSKLWGNVLGGKRPD